jgi:outer membrane protein
MRRGIFAEADPQTPGAGIIISGLVTALVAPACVPASRAETMSSALVRAYAGNPDLNQQRAGVRATDETLPRATAAWRPTATATGQFGYNYFDLSTSALSSRTR